MRRYLPLLLALLLAPAFEAAAQDQDQSSFAFLLTPSSARSAALAEADGALPRAAPTTLFSNPALLSPRAHGLLALSYLNHVADVNGAAAAYAHHLPEAGTAALAIRYLGYGSIEERSVENEESGESFGAYDLAVTSGYAFPLMADLRFGVNAHLIHSRIAGEGATALALDGGLAWHLPEWLMHLGLSVHNLGGALDAYVDEKPHLPTDVRLHLSKRLRYLPLTLGVSGRRLHEPGWNETASTTAGEIASHVVLSGLLHLGETLEVRLGYSPAKHIAFSSGDRLDFAGVHMGAGLEVAGFQVDYAMRSWSDAGLQHHLSVTTRITD